MRSVPGDCGVGATMAAVALLDDVLDRLRSIDPGSLSDNGLTVVARRARGIDRAATALVATVGAEANRRREFADRAARAAAASADLADDGGAGAGCAQRSAGGESSQGAEDALRDPTVSPRRAREEVRRAQIAHRFPSFGAAVARGTVSVEHLDALYWAVDPLRPDVVALLLERSAHLVAQAERHSPGQFAKVLRALIDTLCSKAADELAAAQRAASELSFWRSADGMGHFRGALDPERFALLVNQIEAEVSAMVRAAERDGVTLARSANLNVAALSALLVGSDGSAPGGGPSGDPTRAGGSGARGGDRRPLIHLLIDARTAIGGPHEETVCETVDGVPMPLDVLSRYAYGAVIQAIGLGDDGLPLNVGRQYRTATLAQWAALTAMYSHCGWPRCDQPVSRCQAHHVWSWEEGGPTDLDNLVPLCLHHHGMVHHRGWKLRLGDQRRLNVSDPGGELFATAWPNRAPREAGGRDGAPEPRNRSGRSGGEPP